MKNITELNTELCKLFEGLRDGAVEPKVAKEMTNAAGKIINIQKVQVEYNLQSGRKEKRIKFLED